MARVVDTSVLLDIQGNDPKFGAVSARCLSDHLADGLILRPVSYVELAPAFGGNTKFQEQFLKTLGVQWSEPWRWQDTLAAHRLWASQVAAKRAGTAAKRPVADVLIEAFTQRFQGLITRNPKHFATVPLIVPSLGTP